MEIKKLLSRGLIVCSVLLITGYILFTTVLNQYYHETFPLIFIYFLVLSAITGILLINLSAKNPGKFSFYFFTITLVKLMLHLVMLVILLFFFKDNVITISLFYISMYVIFKMFEVLTFQSFNRKIHK